MRSSVSIDRLATPEKFLNSCSARAASLNGSFANSFTPLTLAQPDGWSLDPETGSQVEVGQRFHTAGDRLQLNTSVYRILKHRSGHHTKGDEKIVFLWRLVSCLEGLADGR